MKTCLKWHGGKSYLAAKIRELFPPHTRYCEPYFGGGSVLFAGDGEGVAEFANDVNCELTNFWLVMQSPSEFSEFHRRMQSVPFSQVEFEYSADFNPLGRPVARAMQFFIRNRQSRQGLGKDFATPTRRLRRGMNENVSAWLSAIDGLPEFHARLKRVEIRNQPALDFIRELDSPGTLFYCDPPYLHETRSSTGEYEHEMTMEQHDALLIFLGQIKGKFLLSGYRSELYDEWANAYGFIRHEFQIDNKASAAKSKAKKTECVWANFQPVAKGES